MKVKELIGKLQKLDQEKEVVLLYDNGYGKASCDVVKESKNEIMISENPENAAY